MNKMKLTKSQLNDIKEFVELFVSKNDVWHRMFHINQTVKIAKYLAKKEKADVNKCVVAAYMHDIAKHIHEKDHGNEGAKLAAEFLRKINLKEKDVKDISYAIQRHNKGGKKKSKEADILWDADKLQALGSCGVLRVYGWYIFKGYGQEEAYKNYCKESGFYARRFHTKTAKSLAKKYIKFDKIFAKVYKSQSKLK